MPTSSMVLQHAINKVVKGLSPWSNSALKASSPGVEDTDNPAEEFSFEEKDELNDRARHQV